MSELLKQGLQFWKSAETIYKTKDYTSATVLYFKSLFVLLDYFLEKRINKLPKDHTERFMLLKKDFPEEYEELDKYYPLYRSTYNEIIEQNQCEEIRNYVKRFAKKEGINLNS